MYEVLVLAANASGLAYFVYFFLEHGYAPSPLVFDKSDSFMDFFNSLYWAYDDGRYTDWGSIYPALSFYIFKGINFLFGGATQGDPHLLRAESPFVIVGICLIYLAVPALILRTRLWMAFGKSEKVILYLIMIFSSPMLFALERGNILIVTPLVLAIILSRSGISRHAGLAILINIKPYFVLLMIHDLAKRNLKGFVVCCAFSGLIFVVLGLALDYNFLTFLSNIFNFANEDLFSPREVLGMPSTISAFSYVLKDPLAAKLASEYLNIDSIYSNVELIILTIEAARLSALTATLLIIAIKASLVKDVEIISILIVVITNLGVSVGGYTLILYIALIPVFAGMRARFFYLGLLAVIGLPLDVISLREFHVGESYSFLSDSYVNVNWTLGAGSVLRPIANFLLLCALCYEIATRKKSTVRLQYATT